jgi:hypothetical protein
MAISGLPQPRSKSATAAATRALAVVVLSFMISCSVLMASRVNVRASAATL